MCAKECSVEGCEKRAIKGGLCGKHFREKYNQSFGTEKMCSVPGCNKKAGYKNFCPMHYQRMKRLGTTELPDKETVCSVRDCGFPIYRDGLCKTHFDAQRRIIRKAQRIKDGDVCSVFNCEEPVYAKGLCNKHYGTLKRTGDVITTGSLVRKMSVRDRMLLYANINEKTKCWEWTKNMNKRGYGVISIDDYPELAHRIAYQEFIGPIPENMCVCHKCDNRKCINPAHLFLGTTQDNTQDKMNKGRHVKGEDQHKSILTESDVVRIKKLLKKGVLTNTEIGEKFGVSSWAISRIKCGKNWKHVEI